VAPGGGASVCLLCKRQFKSAEALAKHELLSELHQQNLEIQRVMLEKQAKEAELEKLRVRLLGSSTRARTLTHAHRTATECADCRIQEAQTRRHGPDSGFGQRAAGRRLEGQQDDEADGLEVRATAALRRGTEIVGSRLLPLLTPLSCRQGEGLGKASSGMNAPIAVHLRSERAGLGTDKGTTPDMAIQPVRDVGVHKRRGRERCLLTVMTRGQPGGRPAHDRQQEGSPALPCVGR